MKLPSPVSSSSSSKGSTLSDTAAAAVAAMAAAEIEGNVLPGHAKARVASVEIHAMKKKDTKKKKQSSGPPYACATCGKVFMTKQALGGHQNAHRERKAKAKKKKQKVVVAEFLDHMKQEDEVDEARSSNVRGEEHEVNDTVDGLDLTLHL